MAVGVCALLTGLAGFLGAASVAHGATPVLIGPGNEASIAVDAAGTAFIAYNDNDQRPAASVVHFCRLPRGAPACDHRLGFELAGVPDARPHVFVDGQTVRILSSRYGHEGANFRVAYVLTSSDGGSTFGAAVRAGTVGAHDAVAGPGADGISMVSEYAGNGHYQRVDANKPFAVDEGGRSTLASANFGGQYRLVNAVGLANSTTPLVTLGDFGTTSGTSAFRVFKGTGDVNDAANWSDAQVIGPGGYGRLAEGPSGLFSQLAAGSPNRLDVRRFDGTTFGAPTSIPIAEGAAWNDLAQDPGGMLFSLWPENSGVVGPRLRYASSADGVSWRAAQLAAFDHFVYNIRAAAAADHLGYAVMDVRPPAGPQVYAVPLAPVPAATPPRAPTPPPGLGAVRPPAGAPTITALSMTRRSFCVGRRCPRARRGTTLRFALSQPATIKFGFERRSSGRRVGGRCRRATRANRGGKRCSYYAKAGSFSRSGVVGANSVAFSGRIAGRALRRGSYRLSLTATGASGARTPVQRIRFRVDTPIEPAAAGR